MESKNIAVSILTEILPHIEAYSNSTNAKPNIDGFNNWMLEKIYGSTNKKIITKDVEINLKTLSKKDSIINGRIASGIGLLNRFTKLYAKYCFENSIVKSIDEFTYLAALQYIPFISKTELIEIMVQEKSTGSEIIKRLLKNNLITEVISKEDKRSKLVSITTKGKKELNILYPILENISNKVVGNLTSTEKKAIDSLLVKLEDFHRQAHKKQ